MAGDLKSGYGSNNQTITITLASLANNGQREATAIDNSSNKFKDAGVGGKVKTAGSGTSASGYIAVYGIGSVDGGTTYTEGATGSDAGITLTSPPNAPRIGTINAVANATTYKFGPMSVAAGFGFLPDHWSIAMENKTGGTLDSTGGNHGVWYQGYYETYT